MTPQYTRRHSRLPRKYRNAIRDYRLKAHLTQAALAEALRVHPDTISAWERGLTCPIPPLLMRLARALDTLAEHLYRDYYWPRETEAQGQPTA